jgi:sugar-specific transcriptional regulator TrmB
MIHIKDLQKLGLSLNEATLYLSAVRLHTFSLAEISKKSGVKRTSCYSVIDSLLEKNFIAKIPRSKTAMYIVVDPLAVLEREKEKMLSIEVTMRSVAALRNTMKGDDEPQIELFSGIENAKQIFHIILNDSPKELYGIVNPEYIQKCLGQSFTNEWIQKRVKKNIQRFDLQQRKYQQHAFTSNHQADIKRLTKFLPHDFDHESTIQIWNNKVGFISDRAEGVSFIVTSKEFSKVMRGIFKSLWETSK